MIGGSFSPAPREQDSRASLPAGKPLVVFTPILVLLAAAALLAMAAWAFGWYQAEMLRAAEVLAGITGALAIFLLYRQVRQRQAAGRAVQDLTARMGDIVEAAMDPIITVDDRQRIVLYNAAAERAFGWPRVAVLGQPLDMLLPQRFREIHRAHIGNFARTGSTSRRMGSQMALTARRADGSEFPIEASISRHSEDGRKLFTAILRDIGERVRAEEALRRSKEELQELGAAAHLAREQEKSRVARELHDELGQSLTALQMDVAWFKERIPRGNEALAAKLDKMQAMLDATVAATRRIAADLRPLMLDDLGLIPAVEWLVEDFSERSGIRCDLAASDDELELPKAHASAVFRIIQESLTNVTKHARASRVEVAIAQDSGLLTVEVRDNGAGFALDAPRKPDSYGLLGLRERAALLGGEAAIVSAPGKGTQIMIRLPVRAGAPPS